MKQSILFLSVFFAIILSACTPNGPPPIDLNVLEPLPTPSGRETIPLRVAIAAVISPPGTVESYTPLLDYIELRLGRPVELVQSSTYAESNEILESGLVDLAFVCTGAYISGAREFGMQILVAPEVDGESAYHSWLIVPVDSSAQNISDLRGKVFAFTDPLSLTGWSYPNYLVQQLGERSETFFARTFFTYSHDSAIRAVANGQADGAAVDSLIYNYLLQREPDIGERLRIIHRSPAFGMPPVVVSPDIRPQLRAELQDLFLNMAEDPDGRAALDALGIDSFVILDDSAYDSARQVVSARTTVPTVSP